MKRRRYYDDCSGHYYTEGNGVVERTRGYRLEGSVATAHGYVQVVALTSGRIQQRGDDEWPLKKWGPVTRLYFITRGTLFVRNYPRILSRRGAVRCAARFALEIAGR